MHEVYKGTQQYDELRTLKAKEIEAANEWVKAYCKVNDSTGEERKTLYNNMKKAKEKFERKKNLYNLLGYLLGNGVNIEN